MPCPPPQRKKMQRGKPLRGRQPDLLNSDRLKTIVSLLVVAKTDMSGWKHRHGPKISTKILSNLSREKPKQLV